MNERIHTLAEEAGLYCDGTPDAWDQEAIEKFAELIVKECVGVVNKRYMGDNKREDMEVRRCVEDLKRHFGVEE